MDSKLFKKGDVVKALDRENFGRVVEINEDVISVKFISPEGSEATVKFASNQLEKVEKGNQKDAIDSSKFENYKGKSSAFSEAISHFSSIGDVFIPAFGGIYYGGEDVKATSEMTISVEDWIAANPNVVQTGREGAYTFEPISTGSIKATTVKSDEECELHFPAGVIPIYGITGSGKTELAAWLTGQLKADYMRFGEPEIPSIHNPSLLIANVHKFMNHPTKKILIIDSFRPFFYMTTEKASIGKGGINNALYMDFTALSSIATLAGKTIFIVINPLAVSKDDVETTRGNIESSTMGLIHVTSYGKFTYVARTIESQREAVSYSVDMKFAKQPSRTSNIKNDVVDLDGMDVSKELSYDNNAWTRIFQGIQSKIVSNDNNQHKA